MAGPRHALDAAGDHGILILIDWWGLRLFGSAVDHDRFGTVGDWASGIGTVAAFVAGLLALRIEYRRDERNGIAQRTSLYGWLRFVDDDDSLAEGWYLYVANGCAAPIYLWRIEITGVGHLGSAEIGPLPPGVATRRLNVAAVNRSFVDDAAIRLWFLDPLGTGWVRRGARPAEKRDPRDVVMVCAGVSASA